MFRLAWKFCVCVVWPVWKFHCACNIRMLLTSSKATFVHVYLCRLLQWLASLLSLNCLPATLFHLVWQLSGRKVSQGHRWVVLCFHTKILRWKIPQYLLLQWESWCRGEQGQPGNLCAKLEAVVRAFHLGLNTKKTKIP